jgi:N-acetylglucosamine-6-phosphate deacetylase
LCPPPKRLWEKAEVVPVVTGHILTPKGFVAGSLELGRRITAVTGEPIAEARVRDAKLPIVLPGFIDLHVHGGGGRDVMDGEDAARHVARVHAKHGTTSLLATTMTAPEDDLRRAFRGIAGNISAGGSTMTDTGGAHILGVHLEGPFIAGDKLGAQPAFDRPVAREEIDALDAIAEIRLVTIAPEVAGHLDVIPDLVARGIVVQLGHSSASYEVAAAALAKGARGFTHLFNAMSPFHQRAPGMVGAALAHADYAELIVDLLHVHPGALRAALRAIPHAYCVTDSTAAAGMPDGDYRLGRQTVTKCGAGVRLADGTIAGSTLTMDQAFANLVDALGLGIEDAAHRVSTFAADLLGIRDRGRIEIDAFADVVVLDRDLALVDVFVEGHSVELA